MAGRADGSAGGSQHYIGIPSGVVFCVDQTYPHGYIYGKFYHAYSRDAVTVRTIDGFCMELEKLFDSLKFPWPGTELRSFQEPAEPVEHIDIRDREMTDEELLQKHGALATFIVRVQQRHNSTWQGRLTWVEKDSTRTFQSVWELVRLLEEVIVKDE